MPYRRSSHKRVWHALVEPHIEMLAALMSAARHPRKITEDGVPACCADLHEGAPRGRCPGVGGPAAQGVQQGAHGGPVLPQVQPAPAQPPPDIPVARRDLRRFCRPRQGNVISARLGSGMQAPCHASASVSVRAPSCTPAQHATTEQHNVRFAEEVGVCRHRD